MRSSCLLLVVAVAGCRSRGPLPDEATTAPLAQALARAGAELVAGNDLELIENSAVFDAMEADIRRARTSVNIVTYIWRGEGGPSERIGRALLARRKGVACRIVIDPFGSWKFSESLEQRLTASGCTVRRYGRAETVSAIFLARNHRKIQVTDGRRAITGGYGIWKSWEGHGRKKDEWRDTAVGVAGPVVAQMQRAFEQSWTEAGGEPLPAADYPALSRAGPSRAAFVASSPRRGEASPAEIMTHALLAAATRDLWIANSYFVPDEPLRQHLVRRRQAGAKVRVIAPGPVHDVPPVRAGQRDTYEELLQAGVRVFEYQPSMMHSKTMVVDDRWVAIGSTNFDQMSFDHLEEGSLVADAPVLARKLRRNLEEDLRHCKEITRAVWEARDLVPEVARDVAGLFNDWL